MWIKQHLYFALSVSLCVWVVVFVFCSENPEACIALRKQRGNFFEAADHSVVFWCATKRVTDIPSFYGAQCIYYQSKAKTLNFDVIWTLHFTHLFFDVKFTIKNFGYLWNSATTELVIVSIQEYIVEKLSHRSFIQYIYLPGNNYIGMSVLYQT